MPYTDRLHLRRSLIIRQRALPRVLHHFQLSEQSVHVFVLISDDDVRHLQQVRKELVRGSRLYPGLKVQCN